VDLLRWINEKEGGVIWAIALTFNILRQIMKYKTFAFIHMVFKNYTDYFFSIKVNYVTSAFYNLDFIKMV